MSIHSSEIRLINEPNFTLGSKNNTRRYITEVDRCEGYAPAAVHGVLVNGKPVIVVATSGGATSVHTHSMVRISDTIYFAVGAYVCRMSLGKTELDWMIKIDAATCLGIYYSVQQDVLISHGELEISRFKEDGTILWSSGGADIFTGKCSLLSDFIEAIDFHNNVYHFDYSTGASTWPNSEGGSN